MSRIYSHTSLEKLSTCAPELQRVFMAVLQKMDHTIIEGHRGEDAQNAAYAQGRSKLPWPQGKHNKMPSEAVDATPYPIDWKDIPRQCFFAGLVRGTAHSMGIDLRWGGDWNQDTFVLEPETFQDLQHFELVKPISSST